MGTPGFVDHTEQDLQLETDPHDGLDTDLNNRIHAAITRLQMVLARSG